MMNIYASDYPANEKGSRSDVNSLTTTAVASSPTSPGVMSNTESQPDLAEDVNQPVPGWPALARLMADKPALEAFPSFTDLSLKSLLYYQAELISLRKELHEAEWKDLRSPDEEYSNQFAGNLELWIFLAQRDKKPEQCELIDRIRIVLDKYHTALLQFSQISALPDADNCNVVSLKECVRRISKNSLSGPGASTWGNLTDLPENDQPLGKLFLGLITGFFKSPDPERKPIDLEFHEHLIVPRIGRKPDSLTLWVAHSFLPLYHRLQKDFRRCIPKFHKRKSSLPTTSNDLSTTTRSSTTSDSIVKENLTTYSESWIVRVTSILTTVVACLLPTVAISILARVQSMSMILGLIALFTAVFAIGLVLLSSGSSRVEIFTATAAFSAVMVVFVQNKIQGANPT